MSVSPLLNLGDLDGARMRALEARELAYRVAFEPPAVSAGIDLLFVSARSYDPGCSETLLCEMHAAVEQARGWHAWKWRLRLAQAEAELALARGRWDEANNSSLSRHRPEPLVQSSQIRSTGTRDTCPGKRQPRIAESRR